MPNRTALAGVALLSALAVAAVLLTAGAGRPDAQRIVTTGSGAAASAQLRQRVSDAAVEARALVELGERRSRDLFAIRSGQRRMEEKLAAADAAAADEAGAGDDGVFLEVVAAEAAFWQTAVDA